MKIIILMVVGILLTGSAHAYGFNCTEINGRIYCSESRGASANVLSSSGD